MEQGLQNVFFHLPLYFLALVLTGLNARYIELGKWRRKEQSLRTNWLHIYYFFNFSELTFPPVDILPFASLRLLLTAVRLCFVFRGDGASYFYYGL